MVRLPVRVMLCNDSGHVHRTLVPLSALVQPCSLFCILNSAYEPLHFTLAPLVYFTIHSDEQINNFNIAQHGILLLAEFCSFITCHFNGPGRAIGALFVCLFVWIITVDINDAC